MNTNDKARFSASFALYCRRAGFRPVTQFTGTGADAIGEACIVKARERFVVESVVASPDSAGFRFSYPLGSRGLTAGAFMVELRNAAR